MVTIYYVYVELILINIFKSWISGMFCLLRTGYDGHVPVHKFYDTLQLQSCAKWFEAKHGKLSHMVIQHSGLSIYISDITMSCDSHRSSYSQHSYGAHTDVWESLASLVTGGL